MAGVGQTPSADQPMVSDGRDYPVLIARAKALIPQLRDRAARTEELRRLPPETERDLHDAGLFRIMQPKRVGGAELNYVELVDCAEALGKGDASVAWNFANLASHHWMLAMFDKRAQDLSRPSTLPDVTVTPGPPRTDSTDTPSDVRSRARGSR